MKFTYLSFLLIVLLFSCNVSPKEKVVPTWEMEILGPLVKTELGVQDIVELQDIHATQSISLSDLGVVNPGIPVIIPPIASTSLGPFNLDMSDVFKEIEVESGELYFTISNELEININAGTQIIITQNGIPLIDNTTANIAPSGGFYESPKSNLANQIIQSEITLDIENFSSQGSNGQFVTIDPSNRFTIDIYMNNIIIKSVTFEPSNDFEIADTSDFSLKGDFIKAISVNGVFNTYIKNGIPINFDLQVYFLDQNQSIILDSLFDTPTLIPASSGSPEEIKLVTNINLQKMQNLTDAFYTKTNLKLSTGAVERTLEKTDKVDLQIVGDLKLKVN